MTMDTHRNVAVAAAMVTLSLVVLLTVVVAGGGGEGDGGSARGSEPPSTHKSTPGAPAKKSRTMPSDAPAPVDTAAADATAVPTCLAGRCQTAARETVDLGIHSRFVAVG